MEQQLEGVLTVTQKGKLKIVVYHNVNTRCQEFYKCELMGLDEIKEFLDEKNPTAIGERDRDQQTE